MAKSKAKFLVVYEDHIDEGDTLEQAWEEACSYHGGVLDIGDAKIYEAREIEVEIKIIEKQSPVKVG